MKIALIYQVARFAYKVCRKTLKNAINDPEKEWDDIMMSACDVVFGVNPSADEDEQTIEG